MRQDFKLLLEVLIVLTESESGLSLDHLDLLLHLVPSLQKLHIELMLHLHLLLLGLSRCLYLLLLCLS